mgnify:CR=1 FL=1
MTNLSWSFFFLFLFVLFCRYSVDKVDYVLKWYTTIGSKTDFACA